MRTTSGLKKKKQEVGGGGVKNQSEAWKVHAVILPKVGVSFSCGMSVVCGKSWSQNSLLRQSDVESLSVCCVCGQLWANESIKKKKKGSNVSTG